MGVTHVNRQDLAEILATTPKAVTERVRRGTLPRPRQVWRRRWWAIADIEGRLLAEERRLQDELEHLRQTRCRLEGFKVNQRGS